MSQYTNWSWPCVLIESPYSGDIEYNVNYARCAMRDCLKRGEAPFASHLLYTQSPNVGFVQDNDVNHICVGRDAAIEAGLAWGNRADKTVVYKDLGITKGMKYGIIDAHKKGRPVEYRTLRGSGWEDTNI